MSSFFVLMHSDGIRSEQFRSPTEFRPIFLDSDRDRTALLKFRSESVSQCHRIGTALNSDRYRSDNLEFRPVRNRNALRSDPISRSIPITVLVAREVFKKM